MICPGKDPDRPYFSSRYALVLGSRARSVAKGDPGAILTRRKQRARTVRTTGMLDNNLLVKKVSIGGFVAVEGLVSVISRTEAYGGVFPRTGVHREDLGRGLPIDSDQTLSIRRNGRGG
jgi:hypothetical protein